ncbi:hypothetical protein CFP65_0473 [Kitasatospora sp. MMS16-BH015]|uniref:hypothetical protein n=1 Tax=Kitasatospora sp. MMS16-BH015 TaxID=2018025 RepID=UPI000CA2168B|nr:hypothetical protein [Kitasatospora sp. MMS16-BH015]AUG75436.1 hypothetical protein CFP65_0473 [Kitasatospora sp. MMS16-BH015]
MLFTARRSTRSRHLTRRLAVAGAALAATAGQVLAAPVAGARGPGPAAPLAATPHATTISDNQLPFTTRYEHDMHGSITRISNSLMTCDETKQPPLDPNQAACVDARKGDGPLPINNNFYMKYINIDPGGFGPAGDPIYSASSADLHLMEGSEVKYARLYWGGTRGIGSTVLPDSKVDEVYLKLPGDAKYTDIANDQPTIGSITTTDESSYQASADVTDLVRQHGNGTYTVANMDSVVQPHSWGGWTIVVAYENPCLPYRNIHLWDGFQVELPDRPTRTIELHDLKTPGTADSDVRGKLGYVVYDGDLKWTGDTVAVQTNTSQPTQFTDVNHKANDAFNSTIEELDPIDRFKRNPYNRNNFGYDSDTWDISNLLHVGDDTITVTFDTDKDGYDLGVFFTHIDLSCPH